MKRLLITLVLALFTFPVIAADLPFIPYKNKVAKNPIITVVNNSNLTTRVIIYNNDDVQPEIFSFTCDRKIDHLKTRYYLKDTGVKVDNVDFFIIQLYPPDSVYMVAPYYPPAVVLFDSFIGLDKFGTVLSRLKLGGPGYIVFALEKISISEGVLHQGWSQMYPLESFKAPFKGYTFSNCEMLETQSINSL